MKDGRPRRYERESELRGGSAESKTLSCTEAACTGTGRSRACLKQGRCQAAAGKSEDASRR